MQRIAPATTCDSDLAVVLNAVVVGVVEHRCRTRSWCPLTSSRSAPTPARRTREARGTSAAASAAARTCFRGPSISCCVFCFSDARYFLRHLDSPSRGSLVLDVPMRRYYARCAISPGQQPLHQRSDGRGDAEPPHDHGVAFRCGTRMPDPHDRALREPGDVHHREHLEKMASTVRPRGDTDARAIASQAASGSSVVHYTVGDVPVTLLLTRHNDECDPIANESRAVPGARRPSCWMNSAPDQLIACNGHAMILDAMARARAPRHHDGICRPRLRLLRRALLRGRGSRVHVQPVPDRSLSRQSGPRQHATRTADRVVVGRRADRVARLRHVREPVAATKGVFCSRGSRTCSARGGLISRSSSCSRDAAAVR